MPCVCLRVALTPGVFALRACGRSDGGNENEWPHPFPDIAPPQLFIGRDFLLVPQNANVLINTTFTFARSVCPCHVQSIILSVWYALDLHERLAVKQ